MKANIVGVGAVLAGAVLLAGCSSSPAQPSDVQSQEALTQSQTQIQVQTQPTAQGNTGSGISDWVAGIAGGKKMQCDYKMGGEGDKALNVKMFADKDHYRTEMVTSVGTMISVSDGKTMYSWTLGKKQGMKMDLECAKSLKDSLPKTDTSAPQTYDTPEKAIGNIPNISCNEASSTVDFSVPTDIEFADQCAMLKNSLETVKNMQGKIPDSVKNLIK